MNRDQLLEQQIKITRETSAEQKGLADHLAEEWTTAELTFNNENVKHTISIFGSARIPEPENCEADEPCAQMSHYYAQARELSYVIGQYIEENDFSGTRLITGGGPGIMEAASRGAHEAGHPSIGLNIQIPKEQRLNPFIAAKHSIEFQYFALRKMHFLKRAKAVVVFPGGFGTLDELFETLTLIQTNKMPPVPILLFGSPFWSELMNLNVLAENGLIDVEDSALYQEVNSVEEAWNILRPIIDKG